MTASELLVWVSLHGGNAERGQEWKYSVQVSRKCVIIVSLFKKEKNKNKKTSDCLGHKKKKERKKYRVQLQL